LPQGAGYPSYATDGEKWNDRDTPFYAKLKFLKLADLIEFEKACFIFKHKT